MSVSGCFEITHSDSTTSARRGKLMTAHGVVETPVFMPVGTQATVKAMTPAEMKELGVPILLSTPKPQNPTFLKYFFQLYLRMD